MQGVGYNGLNVTRGADAHRHREREPVRRGARSFVIGRGLWIVGAVAGSVLTAADPVLGPEYRDHVAAALRHLNMDESDLGFEKDVAEPRLALARVRRLLNAPLAFPVMADEALTAVAGEDGAACWQLAAGWLEVDGDGPSLVPSPGAAGEDPPADPGGWQALLEPFRVEARRTHQRLQDAYAPLAASQRETLAATLLGGVFLAEDDPEARRQLRNLGISSNLLERVIEASKRLDPAPPANAHVDGIEAIDLGAIAQAARSIHAAAETLRHAAVGVREWPSTPVTLPSPLGNLRIGTTGDDLHADAALLILDPGGNDTYLDPAGTALGLESPAMAVIVDLAGEDTYTGRGMLGPGSALFGVACLIDAAGNDTYRCAWSGLGAGLFGAAVLVDEAGHDTYHLYEYGQGSAVHLSLGLLSDRSGNDTYSGFSLAQGSAHDYAVGMLLDHDGNDLYTADHYAQGLAINNALGLLLDAGGNDSYFAAKVDRAQGIGNDGRDREYGALGLLLDLSGTDRYSCGAPDGARAVRPNHGIIYDLQE